MTDVGLADDDISGSPFVVDRYHVDIRCRWVGVGGSRT